MEKLVKFPGKEERQVGRGTGSRTRIGERYAEREIEISS
jgi:hypothetical protein